MCKDVKCPICGSLQKRLYLEETNGWFVCSECGTEVMIPEDAKMVKILVLPPKIVPAGMLVNI